MHIQISQLDESGRFEVISYPPRTDSFDNDHGPEIVVNNVRGSDGTAVFSLNLSLDEAKAFASHLSERIEQAQAGQFTEND